MAWENAQQRLGVRVDGVPGRETFTALFRRMGAAPAVSVELGQSAAVHFTDAGLVTPLRVAHACAQWATETGGFKRFIESMNYSAERIRQVWPSRFPTLASAMPFANNPRALANRTYGGRNGNLVGTDDGFRFIGRGPSMLTGRANYADAERRTGLPLLANPDLASRPVEGIEIACAYWKARGVNVHADADDVRACRLAINGGVIGLEECRDWLETAKAVLL